MESRFKRGLSRQGIIKRCKIVFFIIRHSYAQRLVIASTLF